MSISFHCEYCGKKIEASEKACGKWAKCPACHNKIYVPDLKAPEEEELKLAPIDEEEEKRKQKLMSETFRLEQDILTLRESEGQGGNSGRSELNEKELTVKIILYLRQMVDGDLGSANENAEIITQYGAEAVKIIDRIALSEIPEPELADVPPQVLSGLIRKLRTRISR